MTSYRFKQVAFSLLFALALVTQVQATITNVALYRLGENDPGAVSGGTVSSNTYDLAGGHHLIRYGIPVYTNSVSTNAATQLGSSLAVHFNGANQYFSNAVFTTVIDNFGLEAWVRPNNTNPSPGRFIAYNGYVTNGWGLLQSGNAYGFVFGDVVAVGATNSAVMDVWTHVAVVRNNGTSTLYINGIASGTNGLAPRPVTGGFAVGAPALNPFPAYLFNGTIDEVRVFTFAAGQFSPNDLSFYAPIPPAVTTLPATGVSNNAATLNGTANPGGSPTTAWFQWGTTTNYGNLTSPQPVGSGYFNTNFSQTVTGLVADARYHFRAVASNALGVTFGANQTFTTPVFTLVANLTGVGAGSAVWADYDRDGQLDAMFTGSATNAVRISQIWRNTSGGFSNLNATLPGVDQSAIAWGDFDNDGRLDFILTGSTSGAVNQSFSALWRNTGNGFSNVNLGLPALAVGSAAWADFDNNGRSDFLVTGIELGSVYRAEIWRNTGASFTNANLGFPGMYQSSGTAADYDNDGRLDLLLTGRQGATNYTLLELNYSAEGVLLFASISNGFSKVFQGDAAWADYDNDGCLDFLLTGRTNVGFPPVSELWRNRTNGFIKVESGLPVMNGRVAWGDYDNDGRPDLLLAGRDTNGLRACEIWRNTGGSFSNINAGLPPCDGGVAWGDYDNDGRLDILLAGSTNGATAGAVTHIWKNHTPLANTPPNAPTGLAVIGSGSIVTLSWSPSFDAQTPSSGLSYNVRIGTTPGASDVLAPMSLPNGTRLLPQLGNAQARTFLKFAYTPGVAYYWSVQAIDTAFAGSPFSAESSFKVLSSQFTVVEAQVTNQLSGDFNGDGIVSQSELDTVLGNYFPTSPWLYLTNVAGLGGTNVTFALTNSFAGAFSVEYSSNLANWYFLGPATPRYLFTDSNAPAEPQRFYRLRWP